MIPITVPLLLNALDLVSGFLAAIKNQNISSKVLRDGIFKKSSFLLCYILGGLFDYYMPTLGITTDIKTLYAICIYVFTTETISIIENINKINPDILSEKLLKYFDLSDKLK